MRVVLAVCTYRRTDQLAVLLPGLDREARASGHDVSVLVVDNDPERSAHAVCEGLDPARVAYRHEPRAGIAAARNHALDACAGADVLVFLDDDERPEVGWLTVLLATHAAGGGAGVTGPVRAELGEPADPWIAAGRFFSARSLPTGTSVGVAATNNLLLDVAAVQRAGVRFDDRMGLSGGSDTLFTTELVLAGERLVWCEEAVVTTVVPAVRATRSWVLRRQLRHGNAETRVRLFLAAGARERARQRGVQLARGAVRLVGGAARLAAGGVRRRVYDRAEGARIMARGAGMISGALGHVVVEYRRP